MAETLRILDDEQRTAARVSDADDAAAAPRSSGLSLASLLDLSRELRGVLVMVHPRPEFREDLYGHLLVEVRRQQVLRILALSVGSDSATEDSQAMVRRIYPGYGSGGRRWLIGAAAVGSAASLVGLFAYVRSRHHGNFA
jgi:hypothetical protein